MLPCNLGSFNYNLSQLPNMVFRTNARYKDAGRAPLVRYPTHRFPQPSRIGKPTCYILMSYFAKKYIKKVQA